MIQPREATNRELQFDENRRRMALSEFEHAECQEGFRFELIDGVLHVSPAPDPIHQDLVVTLMRVLAAARGRDGHPLFAHVVMDPRVFIEDDEESGTVPQPDLAAYVTYPPRPVRSYRGLMPVLVVEVMSRLSRAKDLVRNVEIYGRSPDILEYWVIDPTRDAARPTMSVFRGTGEARFERIDIPPGAAYECPRWPGLRIELARIAVE
ncbi:MAG: Uma2 family endonuclease [Phycisphaerae bacterium]